jgi:hypothetical protein
MSFPPPLLGLRLIDIGWKVLARELHPDKGGSREAMTRLIGGHTEITSAKAA